VVGLAVLAALGNFFFLQVSKAQAVPAAPIAFNHQLMVQAGVNCVFCHSGATKSPVAGLPSVQKCMGCHSLIAAETPEVKKLADYWKRQAAIPWPRVNQMPRFVYFSHEVHVTAGGLNCERCHGDVGHMALAQPVVKMNMGWCLDCHNQQPNSAQLKDCVVCHK
jgi:hypothetical protein